MGWFIELSHFYFIYKTKKYVNYMDIYPYLLLIYA